MTKNKKEDTLPKLYLFPCGVRIEEEDAEYYENRESPPIDFENWLKCDCWTLHEAACIASGVHPEFHIFGPAKFEKVSQILKLATRAIDAKALACVELQGAVSDSVECYNRTKVVPLNFLKWAMSKGFALPGSLDTRLQTDLEASGDDKVHGNSLRNALQREEVLGAALACLAKWPDECRDSNGNVIQEKLWQLVDSKSQLFWPERKDGKPPIGRRTTLNLLSKYFKRARGLSNRKKNESG